MAGGDPYSLQRLFELNNPNRPTPAGVTAADIARIFAQAAQQESAVQAEQRAGQVADIGYGAVQSSSPDQAAPTPPSYPTVQPDNLPPLQNGQATPDATAPHPETLLQPGTQGSQVQAPQETTQLQTGVDPATGTFVVQIPGVQGQMRIPLTTDPNTLLAQLTTAAGRWQGADVLGGSPEQSAVSMGRAQDIGNAFAAAVGQLAGQQGAPQGPLTTSTVDFTQQVGGPVNPLHAAALAQAQGNERQAMAAADKARLGLESTRAQGFDQRAAFLDQQAQQAQRQEQEIQAEASRRMAQLDATIQGLATQRIDPNQFFGPGTGGRIVPAIAVALGEIGAGLTGRPNAALQIIDSAVNRNMQAQLANQQNTQRQAQLQSQALSHFQNIVGDRRGAEAALRAANYAAFLNQIDAQMARANSSNLGALQELRNAVLQRMQAEGAVASDRARVSAQIHVQTQQRQRGGATAQDAAMGAVAGAMAQDAQQVQRARQAPPTPQGLVQAGNIDVSQQPRIRNADGSVSNVLSMSFNDGPGREVLIPMVSREQPGRILSEEEAIQEYRRTGRHLGVFATPEAATQYAQQLHEQQGALGLAPQYDENGRPINQRLENAMGGSLGSSEDAVLDTPGGQIRIPQAEFRPMAPESQRMVRAAQERLQTNPNDHQARTTVAAGRRRQRDVYRRVERSARRQLPRLQPWDADDARHFLQDLGRLGRGGTESGPRTPATLPPGFRFMRPEDGLAGNPQELFTHTWQTGGENAHKDFLASIRVLSLFNEMYPRVIAARETYGGEITDQARQMQLARQMAIDLRQLVRAARTGANVAPQEFEEYEILFPDPSEITAASAAGLWDRVMAAWENARSTMGADARAVLRSFGVTTDNATANAALNEAAGTRLQSQQRRTRAGQQANARGNMSVDPSLTQGQAPTPMDQSRIQSQLPPGVDPNDPSTFMSR